MNIIKIALALLTFCLPCSAKRHSRTKKIEGYEKRAEKAAQENTALSRALSKQTKFMTFEEAVAAQEFYRKEKHADMIIKCGERILAVGGDQDTLRATRLELAQKFLEKEKFSQAEKHAADYLAYYPGSAESKEASLIALKATYQSQKSSFNDQTKTRETIERAFSYQEKYPHENEEVVKNIIKKSHLRLIRSELHIIDTLRQAHRNTANPLHLQAARKRLEVVKADHLQHAPTAAEKIAHVQILLEKESHEAGITDAAPTNTPEYDTRTQFEKASDFFYKEDNQRFFTL